jgi:hypothetical protein
LYEDFDRCAARVVGSIDRIVSVAGESKIEDFDKSAAGKVVGDDYIAA